MHVAKGSTEVENAYKYFDVVRQQGRPEAARQAALQLRPGQRRRRCCPADLPMKSLDEMTKYVTHDWAKDQSAARGLDREVSTKKWRSDGSAAILGKARGVAARAATRGWLFRGALPRRRC